MSHDLSTFWAIPATLALAACLAYDLRHGIHRIVTGRSVVLVSVFIWYLLEALRIPKAVGRFTQGEYDFGLLCVGVAVAAFLLVYHLSHFNLFAPLARRMYLLDQPQVLWFLVLAGMTIGFGSLLLYSGFDFEEIFQGLTGMRRRWAGSVQRGRYGSWSTILYELQMFLQAAVPLAVALVFMKRAPASRRWIAGLFVVWMFLRAFWSGTRGPLAPIVLSIAAAVFLNGSPRIRRHLVLLGLPLLFIGGYYWSAVVAVGRNEARFDTSIAAKADYVGFEMFRELLNIVRVTERSLPLQWGMTYYTQLVNPIPRALWPEKPVADAGLIMARAYGAVNRSGEQMMTVSPGFLGEAYLNFGFIGILLIPALAGALVRAWDELLPRAVRSLPFFLVYAAGLATIFASGRSFNCSNYYGLLSLFMLMLLFEFTGVGDSQFLASLAQPLSMTTRHDSLQPVFRKINDRNGKIRCKAVAD